MMTRRLLGWLTHLRDHGVGSSSGYFQTNGLSLPIIMGEPILFPMLVLLAVVWLLPHTPLPSRLHTTLSTTYYSIPSVKVDYHRTASLASQFPRNKTALYLEPRRLPFLTPLLLHMLTVIPPSWSVIFLGSSETASIARRSPTASRYEELGKLRIVDIEAGEGSKWSQAWGRRWDDLSVDEMGNRLLTNLSFYEQELSDVGWLMVWHSDAILCANAEKDLEDWIGWDWVGAPWAGWGRFGGNGGLSIRNVEKVKEVLRFQKRWDDSSPEDQWLSSRLGLLPDANMCPPEKEREFAVEDVWHEWPMGYHLNPNGAVSDVWDTRGTRKRIFDYCPEIKIILDMKLEREKCFEMPEVQVDYTAYLSQEPASANTEMAPAHGMTKEAYDAQFQEGPDDDRELEKHIKELEEAMSRMKKGDEGEEDDKPEAEPESEQLSQELGEPELSDFAHLENITPDGDQV